jgi:hypothetical protein
MLHAVDHELHEWRVEKVVGIHPRLHLYGVTVVLHWRYSGVTLVVQWCYGGVTVVLQWCCSGVTMKLH